jgi:Tol biopolymer transport system component
LAWSPEGKHLVAVEVKRQEGLPLTPDFYEKPNYLYSFHIFTLDLVHNRLIEKQLLSQWQGRIFSVTWWDESTLEFVAKQGPASSNTRYRYSIVDQLLTQLDELEGASNPLASIVHQRKTAIVSRYKNIVQIDFLKEDQSRISRWHLEYANVDVSWIPDGSGILIYAEEERQLLVLYLNGSQEVISLADAKDRVRSRPRYRANGQGIFYTDEIRGANIASLNIDGAEQKITQNADVNYGASFSPDGNRIVYVSIRNNQTQLWLIAAEKEYQLTTDAIAARINRIVWSMDGQHLAYSAGSKLYRYDISSGRGELVLDGKERLQVVAYLPDDGEYFVLKSNGETQNLWRIEEAGQNQKQLTFGAVGSAIVSEQGNMLFQYVGEKGLWTLRRDDDSLELLAKDFSANSQLLQADDRGVYYISGGMCRESDIMFLGYDQRAAETFLTRKNNIVLTSSFNKHQGVLYTECYLAESNIVLME